MTQRFCGILKDGIRIKRLINILHQSFKTITFQIKEEGISIRMITPQGSMLFDIFLDKDSFVTYNYYEPLFFNVNSTYLSKGITSLKTTEGIQLEVNKMDNMNELCVSVITQNIHYGDYTNIMVQIVQNLTTDLPEDYETTVIGTNQKFKKMCKELNNINTELRIQANQEYVIFRAKVEGMYGKRASFPDCAEPDKETWIFDNAYYCRNFLSIANISSLGNNLKFMFGGANNPFCICTNIGSMGYISVYIKTIRQQEDYLKQIES